MSLKLAGYLRVKGHFSSHCVVSHCAVRAGRDIGLSKGLPSVCLPFSIQVSPQGYSIVKAGLLIKQAKVVHSQGQDRASAFEVLNSTFSVKA